MIKAKVFLPRLALSFLLIFSLRLLVSVTFAGESSVFPQGMTRVDVGYRIGGAGNDAWSTGPYTSFHRGGGLFINAETCLLAPMSFTDHAATAPYHFRMDLDPNTGHLSLDSGNTFIAFFAHTGGSMPSKLKAIEYDIWRTSEEADVPPPEAQLWVGRIKKGGPLLWTPKEDANWQKASIIASGPKKFEPEDGKSDIAGDNHAVVLRWETQSGANYNLRILRITFEE